MTSPPAFCTPPRLPSCPPPLHPRCTLVCSLTDEPLDEPAKLLPREAAAAGLAPGAFVALRHGATLVTAGGASLNSPPLLPP